MAADGNIEVVTLGECLVSLVPDSPGPLATADRLRLFVAGAEANVAVGLERLGHRTALIGRVGADAFGTVIRRELRAEGVSVEWLATDPTAPTGVMARDLRGIGPSEVVYLRRGSAGSHLAPEDVDAAESLITRARWLHVTGITPALSASAAAAVERAIALARSAHVTVSLDLNLRRKLWSEDEARTTLRALAGLVDVVLGDLDEARVVSGTQARVGDDAMAAAEALRSLGPTTAVVKVGAKGSVLSSVDDGEQSIARRAPALTSVVDPVGAGDAFAAGFIAARLEGRDGASSLDWGNACGASAVSSVGDQTGLPTRAELERLLEAAGGTAVTDTIR